jgi:glycosyltransferase involved in cell wall biosynthesis
LAQRAAAEWELVVVDNRCTDDTVTVVNRYVSKGAPFRVVSAPDKPGLAYARNVGVRAARFPLIAFCDDDDIVGDGWIDAIAAGVECDRFVASQMEYERLNPPEAMIGRSRFQHSELATMFGYQLSNGAFGIERALWDEVGGNDEKIAGAGEDFDFAIRVQRDCGVAPVLAEDAVYHYLQRAGVKASFKQGRAYGSSHVMLYHRYGQGRADLSGERKRALRDWFWIITRTPLLVSPPRRVTWARRAGLRIGRLAGSVNYRTWYP